MSDRLVSLDAPDGLPMTPEGASERFGATLAPVGPRVGLRTPGALMMTVEADGRDYWEGET